MKIINNKNKNYSFILNVKIYIYVYILNNIILIEKKNDFDNEYYKSTLH